MKNGVYWTGTGMIVLVMRDIEDLEITKLIL